MNGTSRIITLVSVLLVLSACGSSAPVHYYKLETLEREYSQDGEGAAVLGIGPLRTPDSFSRTRIVTRGSNSEVMVDEFNRWAEPMDDAIYRIVAANVDSLLQGVIVIAFPYNHIAELDYRLLGRIDRFDVDEDGHVVLQVQWTMLESDSDFVIQPERVRYETQASRPGDYGSVAQAMSEALAQFSRHIAEELEAAVAE